MLFMERNPLCAPFENAVQLVFGTFAVSLQALKDRDDLRQAAAQTAQTASTTSALYGAYLVVHPGTKMQQSHQQQQQETERGSEVVPADGGGDEERRREREKADEQEKELSLLRKLVEKLQREVEGLNSDLKVGGNVTQSSVM